MHGGPEHVTGAKGLVSRKLVGAVMFVNKQYGVSWFLYLQNFVYNSMSALSVLSSAQNCYLLSSVTFISTYDDVL